MIDRTAQRAAVATTQANFFGAQDASDQAAATAGATRDARVAADKVFSQTSDPAKKEALTQPLLDLQAKDLADTNAAQTAFLASENAFVPWQAAQQDCLTNPGAVEQV